MKLFSKINIGNFDFFVENNKLSTNKHTFCTKLIIIVKLLGIS
jgi:hypothetical protein